MLVTPLPVILLISAIQLGVVTVLSVVVVIVLMVIAVFIVIPVVVILVSAIIYAFLIMMLIMMFIAVFILRGCPGDYRRRGAQCGSQEKKTHVSVSCFHRSSLEYHNVLFVDATMNSVNRALVMFNAGFHQFSTKVFNV
jgi:hypothetical protein